MSAEASGDYSHAEGYKTKADGYSSHAEGYWTCANGDYSHAEGQHTEANGDYSHAEGWHTEANGYSSHAEGYYTEANGNYSHVQGKYNIIDSSNKYAHIVGNGTSSSKCSNAHTLDWDGNAWFAGNVYVGETNTRLARIDEIPSLDNYYTKDEVTNYHEELEAYTDHQVAALVNSAPETLDTIGELAAAFKENQDMIATLNAAIVNKAENNEVQNLSELVGIIANNVEALQAQLQTFKTETWNFTLEDGTVVTKKVVIKD